MLHTVKEIAELTGVTVKTLHHYHKIGLLQPRAITDAGYRLYGTEELERLQQILFYRELDFSLHDICKALEDEPNRLACLMKQRELLLARRQRTDRLLSTLAESIRRARKGETMEKAAMFQGFSKEEWENALAEQNEHLKEKYGYDMLKEQEINAAIMNESALEAQRFLDQMSTALLESWKASDQRVQEVLKQHIEFINRHIMPANATSFLGQTKFFMEDDFHRNMLEGRQTGLCYFLYAAAEMYAARKPD